MKLLFLDIDGVANSRNYLLASPGAFDRGPDWIAMLDPAACARLAEILRRTGAKVVISSSWRHGQTTDEIRTLFARRGVAMEVLGATPWCLRGPDEDPTAVVMASERGEEIQAWLDAWTGEPVDVFAILDDGSDMAHLRDRLVQTSWETGLLDEHVERVVAMLNGGG